METITSRENKLVKHAAKLMASAAARREAGLFVIEGVKLCSEAIQAGVQIHTIFITEKAIQKYPAFSRQISQMAPPCYCISEQISLKISDTKSPQGVFFVCGMLDNRCHTATIKNSRCPQCSAAREALPNAERLDYRLETSADQRRDGADLCLQHSQIGDSRGAFIKNNGRYMALENIQDPGNLGAVLRTADAFGLDGVLLSESCADFYSPKVLRSTMGAAFRVPVLLCPDMAELLAELGEMGMQTYAAALDENACDVRGVSFAAGCVAVVGNEGNGLRPETIAACRHTVVIPMAGAAESLNAAVAAGILMWEMTKGR